APRPRREAASQAHLYRGRRLRAQRLRGHRLRPRPIDRQRPHCQRAHRDGATREGVRSVRVPSRGALRVYLIRDVQKSDLPGLKKLAGELDTVNLPNDEKELTSIVEKSARSFDGRIRDPFEREYL